MRVLFGRVFGIGNAVLSIPALRHYCAQPGYEVTAMVGTTPDDYGSYEVLRCLSEKVPLRVVTDQQHFVGNEWYDIGVLSIPYDGRWNGIHALRCRELVDGRQRPDPSTFGFSSWKDHESVYQLRVAEEVTGVKSEALRNFYGYGNDLDTSFWGGELSDDGSVYLGIGRKYDAAGFWEKKHWGDDNFIALARKILENHPDKRIVCTGNMQDMQGTGRTLMRGLWDFPGRFKFYYFPDNPLENSFKVLSKAGSYIGNDTGMMHVAASMSKVVVAVFNFEGTYVKNFPMCNAHRVLMGHVDPVTVDQVYNAWMEEIA